MSKSVVFKMDTEEYDDQMVCNAHENIDETIAFISIFSKVIRRLDKKIWK